MQTIYRVRRPIKVGEVRRAPGALVPETAIWKPHAVARLLSTGFLVLGNCTDEELEEALEGASDELLAAYEKPEPKSKSKKKVVEAPVEEPVEEVEEEPVEESILDAPEEVDRDVPDVTFSREELEEMDWPSLRELAMDAGLKGNSKREDIIDQLSEE